MQHGLDKLDRQSAAGAPGRRSPSSLSPDASGDAARDLGTRRGKILCKESPRIALRSTSFRLSI